MKLFVSALPVLFLASTGLLVAATIALDPAESCFTTILVSWSSAATDKSYRWPKESPPGMDSFAASCAIAPTA